MRGYRVLAAMLFAGLMSACASDQTHDFAALIEKPPMATDTDRGTVFDSDTLPNIYGMKWRRPL